MLATTKVRDLLRVAIAERDQAAEIEATAARAAVRAKQMRDDAERTLLAFAGVNSEIAAHRADEIRAWAANGGERPTGVLPQHLAAKKKFKVDAETKVTAARSTHELLSAELLTAAGRLQSRTAAVRQAAGQVLSAEAETIVDTLGRSRELVWLLEDKLGSLSAVPNGVRREEAGGRGVMDQRPPITFAALNETRPILASNAKTPMAVEKERWERYLKALTQDPNSTLDS